MPNHRHHDSKSMLFGLVATAILLTLTACSHLTEPAKPAADKTEPTKPAPDKTEPTKPAPDKTEPTKPAPDKNAPRAQLSIGYSLLYQEADGIPKLKWILMFKDKSSDTGQLINGLVTYYEQLADTMRKLSKQYPGMRIDVAAMSDIESETRKAMGADQAKDFAPLVGKSGMEFEREALLMFYNALDEQRHLVGVMLGLETDPGLKKFLDSTKAQLDARYAKVGALLNRRYFTH